MSYVYGLGLISVTDGSGTYYPLTDGLGSTVEVRDSAGARTESYVYDVFGALRSPEPSGAKTNRRFTGQQADVAVLRSPYYLRARHYDPGLGRFLQKDPVPFIQRYAYAGNHPAGYVDPTGLFGINSLKKAARSIENTAVRGIQGAASATIDFLRPALTLNCLDAVVGIGALWIEATQPELIPLLEEGLGAFRTVAVADSLKRGAAPILLSAGGLSVGVATNTVQIDPKEGLSSSNLINAGGVVASASGSLGATLAFTNATALRTFGSRLGAVSMIYSTGRCLGDILGG